MPPNNYRHNGDRISIDDTPAPVVGGALCVLEGIIGVADHSWTLGGGTLWTKGVFALPVPAGLIKGSPVYIAGDPPAETGSATLIAASAGSTLVGVIVSDPVGGKADVDLGGQTAAQASTEGAQGLDVGAPALASANRIAVSALEGNGPSVIANPSSVDGLPRNVTVTATQTGGVDDTPGTSLFTGTDASGAVITEVLAPLNGSTVAGVKAFATVTSIVQSGWVVGGAGPDTVVYGFGPKVGLPIALSAPGKVYLTVLGGAVVASINHADGTVAGTSVDASSGTYDATKHLVALYTGA